MIRSGSIVDIISEVTSVWNPKNSTAPQFHTLHDPETKHVGLWPLSDYWPCRSRSSWLGHSQKTDPLNLIYQKPIPAVAGWQNILRQILFELDNIASIPAWASRSSTLLFVRATDFQAQPIPDRFLQKLLRQFSIFAVVFPVVWQIWDFGKRCKVFWYVSGFEKFLPLHRATILSIGVLESRRALECIIRPSPFTTLSGFFSTQSVDFAISIPVIDFAKAGIAVAIKVAWWLQIRIRYFAFSNR